MAKDSKRLGRGLSSLIGVLPPPQDVASEIASEVKPEIGRKPAPAAPKKSIRVEEDEVPSEAGTQAQSPPEAGDPTPDVRRPDTESSRPTAGAPEASGLLVAIEDLVPNTRQPRRAFDPQSIAALAKSIAQSGLIQPLVVRPLDQEHDEAPRFEIIAGERRWRAAKAAGLAEVPVVVRDADDEQALELALVENIQREDLNAIDRAAAYEAYCLEFLLKPEEVAQRLGEDRSTVVNYLRLLELPDEVKDMVAGGELSMGHARCVLGMPAPKSQLDLARTVVANGLSVRATEDLVRRRKAQSTGETPKAEPNSARNGGKSPHIADLEDRLQQCVGTRVSIQEGRRKGQGRIILEYYSLDDFDRIAAMLGLQDEQ